MAPATVSNWLSFSLSPMEMLRSSSEPQFVSYEGSSAATASAASPHYLIDNFYANGKLFFLSFFSFHGFCLVAEKIYVIYYYIKKTQKDILS